MFLRLPSLRRHFGSAVAIRDAAVHMGQQFQSGLVRDTYKPLKSRKVYLVDQYTDLMRSNPVVLVLHNSTLLKSDDQELRKQFGKAGAKLHIIKNNVFKTMLKALEHPDPASREAYYKHRKTKHPLMPLICGPTALITVPELQPSIVNSVVEIIAKSGSKLVLLGGQVNSQLVDRGEIDQFRKLPSLEDLQAQLVGVLTVLGGANLTQTLESTTKMLYLTMKEHEKTLAGPDDISEVKPVEPEVGP